METSILLLSAGLAHPSLPARFWLRRALAALPGTQIQRIASLEALPARPNCQAIVLFMHQKTLSARALERLDVYVAGGGGLLAIHAASASFKGQPRYFEILGGQFVEHGPVESFEVRPVDVVPSPFAGIEAFTVTDELYRHDYDPGNLIHFTTTVGGEHEPVVWTRNHGSGRVCYCSLGHTLNAVRHPHTGRILRRGLAWVSAPAGEVPA